MSQPTADDREYAIGMVSKQMDIDTKAAKKIVDKLSKPELARLVDAGRNARHVEYRHILGLPVDEKLFELSEGDSIEVNGTVRVVSCRPDIATVAYTPSR